MTNTRDQLDLEGARTEIGYLTMGRMLDAETIAELMEDGAVTWRPISEAVPVERQSIIVCTAGKPPIVGEATWLREDDKELDLWWANTSPGDYYADPISQSNAKVVAFRPMPEAPCDERVKALAKGDSRDVTYIGLTDRLRASEAECEHWKGLADEHALFDAETDLAFKDLDAQIADQAETITSQAEIIKGLREEVDRLSAMINTPEIVDFIGAVHLESVHQRERWGSDHDAGKAPLDWFWLIGYLAQKAATAQIAGDTEKALHHTISTAAALANWHAAISGANTHMRPGIMPPDAASTRAPAGSDEEVGA